MRLLKTHFFTPILDCENSTEYNWVSDQTWTYAVCTSVSEPTNKVWKFNGDDKELVTEEKDKRFPLPMTETFFVQLFSPVSWEPIPGTKVQVCPIECTYIFRAFWFTLGHSNMHKLIQWKQNIHARAGWNEWIALFCYFRVGHYFHRTTVTQRLDKFQIPALKTNFKRFFCQIYLIWRQFVKNALTQRQNVTNITDFHIQ